MALLGLEVIGADDGGLVGAATDTVKKLAKKALPAVADAAADALSDPKDPNADKPKEPTPSTDGFFSKVIVAPVRVWHALLGVIAAGGGLYLWKRK